MKRPLLLATVTVLVLLLGAEAAMGEYLGSDAFDELTGLTKASGGLMDRFPLSAYRLDYHIDTKAMLGAPDVTSIPAQIMQITAQIMWGWTSLVMWMVIEVLAWVMSADFLTGNNGALRPIGDATGTLFHSLFGTSMMQNLACIAGLWGLAMMMNKRYGHMVNGLLLTLVFAAVGLMFVVKPVDTATDMLGYTNPLKLAVLAGSQEGNSDNAVVKLRDRLGETYILRNWARIEFGKLKHCVDTDHKNEDGYPDPVGENDTDAHGRKLADVCRNVLTVGADGHGGYASRFLRAKGEKARKAEYDALRTGEAPKTPQFTGYLVDKADSPAADYMQEGGSLQRLLITGVVCVGMWGAILLFGWLALVMFLLLIAFLGLIFASGIAVMCAMVPGPGHRVFKWWAGKLALVWFAPVAIAIVITMVTALSVALVSATAMAGFWAMLLDAGFCWGLFLGRKPIMRSLTNAVVSRAPDRIASKGGEAAHTAAAVVALPVIGATAAVWNHFRSDHEEENTVEQDQNVDSTHEQTVVVGGQAPAQVVAPAQAGAIEPGQRPRVEYQEITDMQPLLAAPDRTPMDDLLEKDTRPADVFVTQNAHLERELSEPTTPMDDLLNREGEPVTPIDRYIEGTATTVTPIDRYIEQTDPAQNGAREDSDQVPSEGVDAWRFER